MCMRRGMSGGKGRRGRRGRGRGRGGRGRGRRGRFMGVRLRRVERMELISCMDAFCSIYFLNAEIMFSRKMLVLFFWFLDSSDQPPLRFCLCLSFEDYIWLGIYIFVPVRKLVVTKKDCSRLFDPQSLRMMRECTLQTSLYSRAVRGLFADFAASVSRWKNHSLDYFEWCDGEDPKKSSDEDSDSDSELSSSELDDEPDSLSEDSLSEELDSALTFLPFPSLPLQVRPRVLQF
ncbi:hypothetical protein KCU65_g268, partial [Aureobasidium melanogenum]